MITSGLVMISTAILISTEFNSVVTAVMTDTCVIASVSFNWSVCIRTITNASVHLGVN